MTAPQFTPGPWDITSVSMDTGAIGIAKDRIVIAEAHNGYSFMDVVQGREPETQWANARLIAAAPELYEALHEILHDCAAVGSPSNGALERAGAALNKALGK